MYKTRYASKTYNKSVEIDTRYGMSILLLPSDRCNTTMKSGGKRGKKLVKHR